MCLEWLDEESIPAYMETGSNHQPKVYITVGEYDYEISADEIIYRANLMEENGG